MTQDKIDQRHFTTQELAEFLGVHPETIRREAARGRLRSIRVAAERRYAESAVRDYLARTAEDQEPA
jgi:excisionase family DNA binding protein